MDLEHDPVSLEGLVEPLQYVDSTTEQTTDVENDDSACCCRKR
jgi:hypothetical protein